MAVWCMQNISPGTSYVTTKQHFKYTILVDIQNALWKLVTHSELNTTRAQWVCLETENSTI